MAGKKGRSGRRPMRDEEKRLKIIDKAWDIFYEYITSDDKDLKSKAEMASKVVTKDMPTQLEGNIRASVKMGDITVDDDPLQYDIGVAIDEDESSEDTGNAPEVISDSNES